MKFLPQRPRTLPLLSLLVAAALALSTHAASAQALAVQGNRFIVDGQARFLTLVTYFDALDVPDGQLETDFWALRNAVHIDGVRIMPNWWEQTSRSSGRTFAANTVMLPGGAINEAQWARLVYILGRARAHGLIVDVSWTAETVNSIDYGQYRAALGEVTRRLRSPAFNHVMFDLQNESELNNPVRPGTRRGLDENEVRDLTSHMHQQDPGRIVMASRSSRNPGGAAAIAASTGQDVVAWHEPRDLDWYTAVEANVAALRASGKPVYLQEPPKPEDRDPLFPGWAILQAAQAAKRAGAAAWCYHNSAGQWMSPGAGNPSGGIWNRFSTDPGGGNDSNGVDRDVIANLSPWLGEVPWGIGNPPPPPPPPPPPGSAVTFYWDINFSGASFSATSSLDFVGWDWNDQISSIRIPAGRALVLYQDWHFEGPSVRLTGDIVDLRAYGINDWASSFRIE